MARILSIDPSGTSISGLFYFENWNNYEISSISGKNWIEQAKKIENYLKKEEVKILLIETTNLYKKSGYTYEMPALIKLVGLLEYLALEMKITKAQERTVSQLVNGRKKRKVLNLQL